MIVNLEAWNKLSKPYQSILARACDAARAWMLARYDARFPGSAKFTAGSALKDAANK